jgi:hypothetical protein
MLSPLTSSARRPQNQTHGIAFATVEEVLPAVNSVLSCLPVSSWEKLGERNERRTYFVLDAPGRDQAGNAHV